MQNTGHRIQDAECRNLYSDLLSAVRRTVFLPKAAVILGAVVIALMLNPALGQEPPQKESANCLRVPNQIDLRAGLARLDSAQSEQRWDEVVRLYETLLGRTAGKLVRNSDGILISAGRFLRERMVKLCPRAREVYRIRHDAGALRAYEAAARAVDAKQLETLVWKYPLSSCTDDALSLLGAISAESGDFESATGHLDRLLSWCPDTDLNRDLVLMRAAWYCYYSGRHARARRYLGDLRAGDGAKVAQAARYRLSRLVELLKRAKHAREEVRGRTCLDGVPGGGFDRAGVCAGVARFKAVSWRGSLLGARSMKRGSKPGRFQRSERRRVVTPGNDDYRYQSVVYDGRVYTGTEVGVNVFDLRTGRLLMELSSPGGAEFFPCTDSCLAPTVTESSVYANLIYKVSKSEDYNGILIKAAVARYTLCAFDRSTGKLKWMLHKGAKFSKHFAGKWFSIPSAPVLFDGMLIAEIKTRGSLAGSHVAAFDAATGEMKWVRPLCANGTELTMFGYDARGPLSTMLACAGGHRPTVYCCTNLGAIFALDARSGEVRWAASYDQIPLQAARHYYAQMRTIVWANCPPVVSDGVLVVAPLDSEYVYAFDTATGKTLWRYSYSWQRAQFRYLLGVVDEKAILGGARMAAIGLHTGKARWLSKPFSILRNGGRGLVTRSQVLVPRPDGVHRFSLDSGKLICTDAWRLGGSSGEPGNLLETGGRLVVTGRSKLTAYGKGREK